MTWVLELKLGSLISNKLLNPKGIQVYAINLTASKLTTKLMLKENTDSGIYMSVKNKCRKYLCSENADWSRGK